MSVCFEFPATFAVCISWSRGRVNYAAAITVDDDTNRYFRGLNKGMSYYAGVESTGQAGVSEWSKVEGFWLDLL